MVGSLIARKLSFYESSLCLVEAGNDVAMGASKANSGIVHAGYDPIPGTLKAKLNVEGAGLMETLCEKLGVKYRRNGAVVVAFNEEDESKLQILLERGRVNDVKDLDIISGDEVRALEPSLSKNITAALHVPTSATVCPYQLTIAAAGNAMDNGADLKLNFKVAGIEAANDSAAKYIIKSEGGECVSADLIIDCAGAHSDDIAAMVLGEKSFETIPSVGEYILLDKNCSDFLSHTIFKVPSDRGKGVLATRTVDGNVLFGPTAKRFSAYEKEEKGTSRAGLEYVKEREEEFFEDLPLNKVITSFAGVRSKVASKDFIIEEFADSFIVLGGIDSPGLSASPAIANYVEDMLLEKGHISQLKRTYISDRQSSDFFREMSREEQREYVDEHPAYGKIVCRCEGVTEGEIIDAIHRNPKPRDVDGIKRRTRAGMGRCQGGFCLPSVIEILARELECDMREIGKNGPKSNHILRETKHRA